jgi:hypothetical protein
VGGHAFLPFAVQYPPYVNASDMWSVLAKAVLIVLLLPEPDQ